MSETVSIIDDEASVRDAVTMLLETNGYAVASYASVGEFLNAPFVPGAVVSDVRMPEATGLDLLRRISPVKTRVPSYCSPATATSKWPCRP